MPPGFAARKSGLLVKTDLAAEATANTQFTWQATGLDDPEKRGQDRSDFKYERVQKEIETSRKRDPLIFRGVDYYDKLGLGIGVSMTSENVEILTAAERVWEQNDLDDGQHQMSNELVTTANLFIRVPVTFEGEIPAIMIIPNAQIERIATKDGAPWYYRRKWQDLEFPEPREGEQGGRGAIAPKTKMKYEDIPAAELVHIAVNRTAGELRGLSMLEPSIYWTALYGRSLETIWAKAVAQSLIAYHAQIEAASQEQVTAIVKQMEGQLVTRIDPRGMAYKTMATGQILGTGKNVDMKKLDANLAGGSMDSEIRRILLMGAVGMGMPEYVLSDGDTANRATTESQSDPYFRMMQAHQYVLLKAIKRVFRLVFDRFLQLKQFVSVKPPKGKYHIVDWLTFSGPNLLTPDVETLGPVAAELVRNEIWSREYACSQLGSDWNKIKPQIEGEREEGFVSQPQGSGVPPSGATQLTLPLGASADDTRIETETPTQKKQRILRGTLDAFIAEARAAKGDQGKIAAASKKWLETARGQMFELIDQARDIGARSVAA